MPKTSHTLVTHIFKGPRFEDHGIDLDVLPDLLSYKGLLVDTAKELWRRHHPDRLRLPKKFEDSLALKFYEIRPGSAAVPLLREIDWEGQEPLSGMLADELDEAVVLTAETIRAAELSQVLPEEFPKSLLPLFADYGKTLQEGESFEVRPVGWNHTARYTQDSRRRLSVWAERPYEDVVDLTATVTMARVSRPRMALALVDGTEVEATFAEQWEDLVTTALRDHSKAKLHVRGRGQFSGAGRLLRILELTQITLLPGGEVPYDYAARPIWEEIDEIIRAVPAEEFEKLPADGAEFHDHYIYGTPKRPK